uniref:RNA recognition motif domain containing protein n=1 Tax=Babesia bovis TaxID=5865 RepID=S6BMT0_BABBO|nr:RNA recognition motif domain containing protein [Babesia bovis]
MDVDDDESSDEEEESSEDEAPVKAADMMDDDEGETSSEEEMVKPEPAPKKQKAKKPAAAESSKGDRNEIYCGGLPFQITEEEVKELFEGDCGPVERVNLLHRKGIAFITFKTNEAAEKALEYNETAYQGRNLRINITADRVKPEKQAGFGNDQSDIP